MTPVEVPTVTVAPELLARPRELVEHLGLRHGSVRLDTTRISVSSTSPQALRYLHDLFTPANDIWEYSPDDSTPHPLTAVNVTVNDREFDQLRDHFAANAVQKDAVRLHVEAPGIRYRLEDGTDVVQSGMDEIVGGDLIVQSPQGFAFVTNARPYAHLALGRHLREFGYRRGESAGWMALHASCAATPEGNALVIGRSGAGKSTTALALAASPGGGFVANDRVMARVHGEEVTACAMPVPIRINGGTMKALGLDDATSWPLIRPQPDFLHSDWQRFGGDSKLSVLPLEWHNLTGTPLVASVSVTAVVLPRVVLDSPVLSVRRADPEKVRQVLHEQRMTPDDDVFVEDWMYARTSPHDVISGLADRTFETLMGLPILVAEFGTRNTLTDLAGAIRDAMRELRVAAD